LDHLEALGGFTRSDCDERGLEAGLSQIAQTGFPVSPRDIPIRYHGASLTERKLTAKRRQLGENAGSNMD
jgi:hypothetical protein